MAVILVTGASGAIGRMLRDRLGHHDLRLTDVRAEAGVEALDVTKAAMESLGRLHHDRHGLHVICLRIGSCRAEPTEPRHLSVWLSPGDAARLVEAALTAAGLGRFGQHSTLVVGGRRAGDRLPAA